MTSVSMAGEELPVFHDFLGIVGQRRDPSRQPQPSVHDPVLASKKASELRVEDSAIRALPNGRFDMCSSTVVVSDQQLPWPQVAYPSPQLSNKNGFGIPDLDNRSGKRRDISDGTEYIHQQQKQIRDMENLDNSPFLKVSRLEKPEEIKARYADAIRDDIASAMQPPRTTLNTNQSPHSHHVARRDSPVAAPAFTPHKWDNIKHVSLSNGILGQVRGVAPLNLQADKAGINTMPPCPPADEGSRTGMKGSSVGNMLNNAHGSPMVGASQNNTNTSFPSGRSKSWSQSMASESMFTTTSQQTTPPTSRQLTIFYGGQAHVFDDVPSDKVDAIMKLAGSTGRSWSTTYAPRGKTSLQTSGSEGYLSISDAAVEREKSVTNKSSSGVNGFTGLALSEPESHKSLTNNNSPLGQDVSVTSRQDTRAMPLMRASSSIKEVI